MESDDEGHEVEAEEVKGRLNDYLDQKGINIFLPHSE